ncbi:unnamed protein product [Victoria cruziana]
MVPGSQRSSPESQMSTADGIQSLPFKTKPISTDRFPFSAIRRSDDVNALNPPAVARGGAAGAGELTGGFRERPSVLLPASSDFFSSTGVTIAATVDGEAASIGAREEEFDVCAPVPVQVAPPAKRNSEMVAAGVPDWLPEGWLIEFKVRTSGATAGTRDKYFYDPVSNRRFRSKKEVFCFLQTGKLGRYKPKVRVNESDANSTDKDHYAGLSSKRKRFDFLSRPAKVRWVLDGSETSWTPFIDEQEVPESSKRAWLAALDLHENDLDSFEG